VSSKLGSGCVVSGAAKGSVLSMGCRIGEGSVVNDSILLPDAVVGRNCLLDRVIVDSGCHVPDDTVVHADAVRSLNRFHVSPQGIVLLTEDALNSHESALASKKTGAEPHVFLNRGHASPLPGHDRRTA
jgi:glucose-1-phosphate adenylyltransferase